MARPSSGCANGARRWRLLAYACSLWIATVVTTTASAQDLSPKLVDFLQAKVGFTAQEITSASNGNLVVKTLGDSDAREIALVGVVTVHAPRSLVVAQVTDSLASRRDPSRLGFGVFSDPAAPGDVATFKLPHDDVQDLAKCRPGSCKLKLPAQSITDMRSAVDPQSPSADSVASAFVARHMVAYVTAYRAHGEPVLVVYDDQAHPIASSRCMGSHPVTISLHV